METNSAMYFVMHQEEKKGFSLFKVRKKIRLGSAITYLYKFGTKNVITTLLKATLLDG